MTDELQESRICRIVIKTGIETRNETKSAYSLVEDNHYIMHSYTIIYARTTCLCKQDSRWKISLHGAYRLLLLLLLLISKAH